MKHRIFFLACCLLIAGCAQVRELAQVSSQGTLLATPPEQAFIPSQEITATPTPYGGYCSSVWASQPLPEVTAQLGQVFLQAGWAGVEAQATAYGETCVDLKTNALIKFSPYQTDFYINVAVHNAEDNQELSDWVMDILDILDDFQPGVVPGKNPGKVEIEFTDGERGVLLSFTQEEGRKLVEQGLRGTALIEELRSR